MTALKYDYVIDRSLENYASNKILKRIRPGDRVLEVGCSTGYLSRILRDEFGCEVVGVELEAEAAERAREFCAKILVGDVEVMDLPAVLGGERFDVVIFADVLEHLKEPVTVLRSCKALLEDSGRILISVPNAGYRGVLAEMMRGRFARRPLGILDESHRRFLALRDVLDMVAEAELVLVHLDKTVKGVDDSEFAEASGTLLPDELSRWLDESAAPDTYQFVLEVMRPSAESLRAWGELTALLVHEAGREARSKAHEKKTAARVIEAKNRLLAERDEVIRNKNEMIRYRDQVIQNKNRLIEEQRELIQTIEKELHKEAAFRRKMQIIARTSPVYPFYLLYEKVR
jgi:2-polyprenyl-3-methyl-5-hydroxy-6-metoxy-1,4-benzoquinol methylase